MDFLQALKPVLERPRYSSRGAFSSGDAENSRAASVKSGSALRRAEETHTGTSFEPLRDLTLCAGNLAALLQYF